MHIIANILKLSANAMISRSEIMDIATDFI